MIFTCISNGSHTDWYVDDHPEEMETISSRNIGPSIENTVNTTEYGEVLISNISVPATLLPDNNGTEIRCKVDDCPVSQPAILLVQGKLQLSFHLQVGDPFKFNTKNVTVCSLKLCLCMPDLYAFCEYHLASQGN